jgi:hypothetical protein
MRWLRWVMDISLGPNTLSKCHRSISGARNQSPWIITTSYLAAIGKIFLISNAVSAYVGRSLKCVFRLRRVTQKDYRCWNRSPFDQSRSQAPVYGRLRFQLATT